MKAHSQAMLPPKPDVRQLLQSVRQTGLADSMMAEVDSHVAKGKRRRRTLTRASATLSVLLVAGIFGVPYLRDTATIETIARERRLLPLADGSQAELNARTKMRTDFRYGRRVVALEQGEAFFSVQSDPEHPFLVETPAGTVRVTGTRFNLRITGNGEAQVSLMEGAVRVDAPAQVAVLKPGEQLEFGSTRAEVKTLSNAELENVAAWRSGILVLDELTLGEIVARFADYHGKKMDVDPAIAQVQLGGSCPLDDLPQLLRALEATQMVEVLADGDRSYRILPRK
jgi:transmembrane sensor